MEKLSGDELTKLIQSVFPLFPQDQQLAILVDVPRDSKKDNPAWKQRRTIAEEWFNELNDNYQAIGLEGVYLVAYPDVGSNNADLPGTAYYMVENLPGTADQLELTGKPVDWETVFSECQLFLAPTEFSTTAPLKNAAKTYHFRAATMPGFSPDMLPALRIDYNEVSRRVSIIKDKLDPAVFAKVIFCVDNHTDYPVFFDLRFRKSHLSSGRFPEKGTAGNLPSGETYIVPYEGEQGEKSRTAGTLPVQVGEHIAYFIIQENRAIQVEGQGDSVEKEREHLRKEPAFGNIAELGFGVLGDFGLAPINEILLDEKLGFHVAFGRSDHFGGAVGPAQFSSPAAVIHLDRIYIPATQPRITVKSIILGYNDSDHEKNTEKIMEDGHYLVF